METRHVLELNTGLIEAKLAHGTRTLVREVSVSLDAGETMALIGETGSGKTMTALSLMRLLPANVRQRGETVLFQGRPLPRGRAMRRLLGSQIVYIPQNGAESLDPSRTVRAQLLDGLRKNRVPARERVHRAEELLRAVGFDDPSRTLALHSFALSGGMAQRVTIALAACGEASLVLADEPTNGLDKAATEDFFALLGRLFPKAARLLITHDISVARLCGRVTVLCRGQMCESGPASLVLRDPHHPYTEALLGALVENGMRETPVLRSGESSCPFYARCPRAEKICREAAGDPPLRAETGRKWRCFL